MILQISIDEIRTSQFTCYFLKHKLQLRLNKSIVEHSKWIKKKK